MIKQNDIDTELLFKELVILPSDRISKDLQSQRDKSDKSDTESQLDKNTKIDIPKQKTPFVLLTTLELKHKLLNPESNFSKIIKSQKIENASRHLLTEFEINESLLNYDCIWSIGLSPQKEQKLLSLQHANILLSPNTESLENREEKLAMFNPFAKFVSSNLTLFSQI